MSEHTEHARPAPPVRPSPPTQPAPTAPTAPAAPAAPAALTDAHQALRFYFGHAEFRPNQRELIEHVLAGRDVLAVMPTGAGKSLVYQIPAMVSDGLTLVISPLISLMKDQVDALRTAGVEAAFLNSSQTAAQQTDALEYAASGTCKLLYVAPERLDAPRFRTLCRTAKLSLIAIDEAHCVSQWGQDFRPSYLRIAPFIDALPTRPPVCALTATATPKVQADLTQALALRNPFTLVSGFDRPNLYFGVVRPEAKDKRESLLRLVRVRRGQSGIIYCATRAAVEEVCELLCENSFPATRYHAGLDAKERQTNQNDFLFDRKPIMVATNAFGMGIDKSNVSFVIHYHLPADVESYYQEAGRAGRDGSAADCILIYNKGDVQTRQFLIEKSHEDRCRAAARAAAEDATGTADAEGSEGGEGGTSGARGEGTETRAETDVALAATIAAAVETSRLTYERDCERLRQMVFYCTAPDCLRSFILRYFGQADSPYRCEHCSNCLTDFTLEDVTTEAQKLLSCVLRLAQRDRRTGRALLVDILRGSRAQRILAQGYDTLSTYGIMRDVSAKRAHFVLDALIAQGYLAQTTDEFRVLELTAAGAAFLKSRETLTLKVPKHLPKAADTAKDGEDSENGENGERKRKPVVTANPELFEELKALRFRLAAQAHVPTYVVFSNATLQDMCEKLPRTTEELLEVSGVGHVKAQRYGDAFLACIRRHAKK